MEREGIHTMRKRLGAATPTPEAVSLLRGEIPEVIPETTAFQQNIKVSECVMSSRFREMLQVD